MPCHIVIGVSESEGVDERESGNQGGSESASENEGGGEGCELEYGSYYATTYQTINAEGTHCFQAGLVFMLTGTGREDCFWVMEVRIVCGM